MSITGSEMKLDALEYQPGSSSSSIFTNRRIASVEAMFPSACQLHKYQNFKRALSAVDIQNHGNKNVK
uniref:Uncharacterized protein n=1 Tax=Rhizophora mucronata TaxID=61149 RepID=A0A2P2J6A3_RHIMU